MTSSTRTARRCCTPRGCSPATATTHVDASPRRWWGEQPAATVPDRAIEPGDTSDDRDELRRMLRALSQQEREVVVLRYYCDLSEKDAAAALRLPVSTVKTAASRVGPPKSTTQSAAACPDNAPTMPHGSGAAPLFPQDVTSINVCAYTLERLTASRLLTGTAAEKYVQRFNALPLRDSGLVACPQFVTQIALAMLPVTPDGVAPTVVGQIGGCGNTSNGVTSRRAGQLLNELAEGIVSSVTSPIPTVPNHSMSHGPGPS